MNRHFKPGVSGAFPEKTFSLPLGPSLGWSEHPACFDPPRPFGRIGAR
jgi:hypothetical protein